MNSSELTTMSDRVKINSPDIRFAIIWGTVGSVLVLIGSLGVGWLPNVSDLNRIEPFIFLRTSVFGVLLSTVLLTAGVWLMLFGWLMLGRAVRQASCQDPEHGVLRPAVPESLEFNSEGLVSPAELGKTYYENLSRWIAEQWQKLKSSRWAPGSLRIINFATLLWSLPLLLAIPIYSRDMYAYAAQGRLVVNGGDPYEQGISTISNWFQLGTDSMWAEDGTPYGPVFIWLEEIIVRVTGDSIELSILLLRLLAFVGVILTMIYTPKIAELHGIDPARAQWISSANTLFIVSFVASGHNDVLMVGFALMAFYYALKGKAFWSVFLLTMSVGVKPITLVLLPFFGLLLAGPYASWSKRFLYWIYCGSVFLVLMGIIGYLNGFGFGWVQVVLGTGTGFTFWSPVGFAQLLLSSLGTSFGFDPTSLAAGLKLVGRLSSVAIVLVLIFQGKYRQISIRMTLAFTALVVLSPVIHPWYLLWLLPFFAVVGIRDGWQLNWGVFTFAFLIGFGAFDQLHVWDFLSLGILPKVISGVLSLLFMIWLFGLNPKTKSFLDIPRIAREIKRTLSKSSGHSV